LIERVVSASAGLTVKAREAHPSVAILGAERSGSGTLIDASGLILTPNYVVVGADSIEITLVDGSVYEGRTAAQDFSSGLAIVKIDGPSPFPTVPLRSSADAKVGDEVFIVASAGGANRRSHDGVVTSLGPFDASWEYRLDRAILTSAVNPGLGGGALFDLCGRMLGVVSLDLGEIGRFTLAVPAECFLDARAELLQSGRRARDRLRAWIRRSPAAASCTRESGLTRPAID
jgi:S1-C subfamily serine protease